MIFYKTTSYGKRYYLLLLLAVILFFFTYTWISTVRTLTNSEAELDRYAVQLAENYVDRISTIDKLYLSLENRIDEQMKRALLEMDEIYRKRGSLDFDYKQLIDEPKYMDLYVIDSNNKVIRTTDPLDLGLDFSRFKKFSRKLTEIRTGEKYVSDRINQSTMTRELKKYSYLPSHDKQYLFEAGYKMKKFEDFLGYDALSKLAHGDTFENPAIVKVSIFNLIGQSYDRKTDLSVIDDQRRYKNNRKALATRKMRQFTEQNGYTKTTYLYYPYKMQGDTGVFLNIGLEIIYTNRPVLKTIQKRLITESAFLAFFVLLLLLLNYYFTRQFLSPLESVIQVIKNVREDNFNSRVHVKVKNEIGTLADNVNMMLSRIRSLLEEKEYNNERLTKALKQNRQGYFETVRALANSIDIKDRYTGGHCERVMQMSMLIADRLNLDENRRRTIKYGSMLHDIGKIGIVDRILNKPGTFTQEEYAEIKKHPQHGYNIIKDIEFLREARLIVKSHHERMDGKGYPEGITGDRIPYEARIVSIADAFDAMTSQRVYRNKRMTVQDAFTEMRKHAGTQFDEDLVEIFIRAYTERYGDDVNRYSNIIEASNGS